MTTSAYPQSHAEVYDAHPFYGRPCEDSHPSRMAVIARLSGIEPAGVQACRVLELGCGDGSNLIAIADSLPGATCVGIDLSQRHIELGQAEASALGLKNLSLRCADLLSLTSDALAPGQFDYIIADCFYSWVPRQAQDQLFALAARHLSPSGVMFVSYNLLPGWRIMQVLRDFLSFHTRTTAAPAERIRRSLEAAELLPLLSASASSDVARFFGAYTRDVQQHLMGLGRWREQALIHDIIADVNTPVYFSTFVNHASRFGLRYLEDAELRRGVPENLSDATVQKLAQHVDNALDLEQYIDFAHMRMYRQSLLCHAELLPKKSSLLAQLSGLFVSFSADAASLSITHPLTRAGLAVLAEAAPRALSWESLCAAAWARLSDSASQHAPPDEDLQQMAATLLRAFADEQRVIHLHAYEPRIQAEAESRPRAPYAK